MNLRLEDQGMLIAYEMESHNKPKSAGVVKALVARLRMLKAAQKDLAALVADSRAVVGWHLNGAEACWDEILDAHPDLAQLLELGLADAVR